MLFKKTFLFFIVSSFLLLVTSFNSTPTFAQTTPTANPINASATATTTNPFDGVVKLAQAALPGRTTLERWAYDFALGSAQAFSNIVTGDKTEYFSLAQAWYNSNQAGIKTPLPRYNVGGLVGSSTQMIGLLYTPAASGVQYVASLMDNVMAKPAYAQGTGGFGFQGLQFLLPLWKGTRNIAYVLSSIIFVIVGLMIILRVKISPQAVVTLQSSIPTIITALILITFSYAIAGFLIDLSNLVGAIVLAIIFQTQGIDPNTNNVLIPAATSGLSSSLSVLKYKELVNPGFATIGEMLLRTAPGWSVMQISMQIGGVIGGMLLAGLLNFLPGGAIPVTYGVGNVVGQFVGIIAGIFLPLIIGVVVGIWVIKMFFGMVTCYVTIIFKIILAPLEIFIGAFPNSKTGFSSWFFDVLANVMVFPIITIFFAILNLITYSIYGSDPFNNTVWAPGPISTSWYGSTSQTSGAVLAALVGLAGLAMAANLPSLIPQYIFMIKPSPFGDAVGKNMKDLESGIKLVPQIYHDRLDDTNPIDRMQMTVLETLRLAQRRH